MRFETKTIYNVVTGSRLYGTNHSRSDWDYRGVCTVSLRDMMHPFQNFEQLEATDEDAVLYHLPKFLKLASDNNPNVIELLFVPDTHVLEITREGHLLRDNANLFVSAVAKNKFYGYSVSQLSRMKKHRRWVEHAPQKPERANYGLPEMPLYAFEKLNSMVHAPIEAITEEMRKYALAEMAYRNASNEYKDYSQWVNERNSVRFEFEMEFGYDLKAAAHIIRLLTEAIELMHTGRITFPCRSVNLLRDVLAGEYSYEDFQDLAAGYYETFQDVEVNVPDKPNYKALTELYYEILGV